MIMLTRFADIADVLDQVVERGEPRRLGDRIRLQTR
jgi:hypothetical protein